MTPLPLEEDFFPPFEGFPSGCLEFFKKLKKNNNRSWFQLHRQEYEDNARFPMQCLIAELAQRMADVAPEMEFNPRRSIFRINRDIRFSKNKSPYKTNIAASFEMRGKKSRMELPGLYVGIEPGEIFIGGGIYMPSGDQLKAIRSSIATRPDDFLDVVEDRVFKKEFREIQGEKLLKAPLGYPKDHPMIEHLRHKQFYVGIVLDDKSCLKRKFLDTVVLAFTRTMPLVRWLAHASG